MIEQCEKQLLTIELKSELISSLNPDLLMGCVEDLDLKYILNELVLLETEYNELVMICIRVRHGIQDYEKQPAGLFYKYMKKLRRTSPARQ